MLSILQAVPGLIRQMGDIHIYLIAATGSIIMVKFIQSLLKGRALK